MIDRKSLVGVMRQKFRGNGVAVRLQHEPKMPGEPYMSMDLAAELAADVCMDIMTVSAGVEDQEQKP